MAGNYCVNEPDFDGPKMRKVYGTVPNENGYAGQTGRKNEIKTAKIKVMSVTKINRGHIPQVHTDNNFINSRQSSRSTLIYQIQFIRLY